MTQFENKVKEEIQAAYCREIAEDIGKEALEQISNKNLALSRERMGKERVLNVIKMGTGRQKTEPLCQCEQQIKQIDEEKKTLNECYKKIEKKLGKKNELDEIIQKKIPWKDFIKMFQYAPDNFFEFLPVKGVNPATEIRKNINCITDHQNIYLNIFYLTQHFLCLSSTEKKEFVQPIEDIIKQLKTEESLSEDNCKFFILYLEFFLSCYKISVKKTDEDPAAAAAAEPIVLYATTPVDNGAGVGFPL